MEEDKSSSPVNNDTAENPQIPDSTAYAPAQTAVIEPQTVLPQQTVVPTQAPTTELQSATPVQSSGPAPVSDVKPKRSKSKWFLPAILAGFLVLGGSAAAYLTVFKKSPESAWESALTNTVAGIDKYLSNSYNIEQKGFKIEGNFKVSSPIAIDGSSEGQWYESNGELKSNVGVAGARFNTNLRTISADGSTTPDLYFKVDGLEGVDDLIAGFGGPQQSGYSEILASINDQWFFVDHTLIDQYTASADSSSGLQFTEEDMKEVSTKVMVVLKDRMFSTASDKAVFNIAETLGKEDFEGTSSYKMRVAVNKDNFKEFVTALKDSIKDTKAEELLKTGNTTASLEEILDFDKLLKDIDDTDFSKATADVWVEANGGFIRNVRLYPVQGQEATNYLDFGLNYTGGDEFPFQIKATMDDDGTKGTVILGMAINQANGDVGLSFDVDISTDGSPIKAVGVLSIKGSNDKVEVEKPAEAKNIFELLAGFQGLGAGGMGGLDDAQLQSSGLGSGFNDDSLPLDDFEL